MSSADQNFLRPPSYYFKSIKVEPEPIKHVEQNVNNVHEKPNLFEPPTKRVIYRPIPLPPPTPLHKPMTEHWLLDPMP